MNLDIEKDNYRFNARASVVIYNKDKTKVLLFKIIDRDYFMLPGGRIEFFEDSKSAIKREIKEETGFDLEYELCSIQENFVEKGNKKIMQYCFCYKSVYNEDIIQEEFICNDNKTQRFYWIDINDLQNYKLLPNSTYALIKNSENIIHIIEKSY